MDVWVVISCDTCGIEFDERAFLVVVAGVKGHFHSFDCAETGYRRFLARQHMNLTYGPTIAEVLLRGVEHSAPPQELPVQRLPRLDG